MSGKPWTMVRLAIALCGWMILSSCGAAGLAGEGSHKPNPPGLFTDATLIDYLALSFDEVKACGGFTDGTFEDITVVMMEPQFPCPWYENGCSGEFVTPNTIKLGSPYVWKHEVVHYLSYINTGQSDSAHDSSLFWDCI